MAGHSAVSYMLRPYQFCVSVRVAIYCKKKLSERGNILPGVCFLTVIQRFAKESLAQTTAVTWKQLGEKYIWMTLPSLARMGLAWG